MKRSAVFLGALLLTGAAQAADGLSLGVGVDYSSGDYGSDVTTKILSVPFSAKYETGDWTFKASLPWMRVDGDANVVPSALVTVVVVAAPIGASPTLAASPLPTIAWARPSE